MFILHADKNKLTVCQREPVTSGSVNVYEARFEFSPDWDGLTRTAVFKAGKESRSVLLDETSACVVPWEVLVEPNIPLLVGVCGTRGGEEVLPTVWAGLGIILEGASTGEEARPPTPDLWVQELTGKGDALGLDGLTLKLLAGGKTLSEVELPTPGGGEGGTSDHRLLMGRDAPKQHPIDSIDGLTDKLDRIPEPVEPLTNEDLEEILK